VKILLEDKNKVVDIPEGLQPNEIEAELRKFYSPEELHGSTTFEEREGYRIRRGRASVDDGNAWYKAMVGEISMDDARKQSESIMAEFTPDNDEKHQAYNWPERFAGAATEILPYMMDSAITGAVYGEAMGATFAGGAMLAGQAGPQAFIPEEIVTVPGAYIAGRSVGQVWGTWMNATKVEGGNAYKTMVEGGIDPATARNFALPAGYLIGALELLQVERLIPSFGRQGITEFLKKAAVNKGSKAYQTLSKASAQMAKNLAATTAIETGQEMTQEIVNLTAEVGAGIYNDMAEEEGYIGPGEEDIKERLQNTLTNSLLGFPLLGLPRAIHSTVSLNGRDRFAERPLTKQAKESLSGDLTELIQDVSKVEEFKEFQDSLGEEFGDKEAAEYGFDNRVLFEEAIWNASRNVKEGDMYAENLQMRQKDKANLMGPIGNAYQTAAESVSRIAEPISTRLNTINPKLKNRMRRYEFDLKQRTLQDEKAVFPFLQKYDKLSEKDQADLDLAFKNNDDARIKEIIERNSMAAEYKAVRHTLDALYERATKTGVNIGYIPEYYPRQIKDAKGMLKLFKQQDEWPEMQKAINEKEEKLGRKLTDNEKAELLNSMLRGYRGKNRTPGNIKKREISVVTPELNKFYHQAPQALLNYIYGVNDYVEARRFFGKSVKGSEMSEEATKASIGNFVLNLLESGEIEGKDAQSVSDVLLARFSTKGPGEITRAVKNISYMETMGSVTSAITQIGDIAFSLYKNGFYNTGKALAKRLGGQAEITREDIGIERIAEEFADKSKTGAALDKVFKMVGLNWMDRLGKETHINAALEKFHKLAKNEPAAQNERQAKFASLINNKDLISEQSRKEAEFIGNNLEEFDEAYRAKLKKEYKTDNPNIISSDVARTAEMEGRGKFTDQASADRHAGVSAYSKMLYEEMLSDQTLWDKNVMVMAGVSGAGKTGAVRKLAPKDLNDDIVYDTNVASLESGVRIIEQALASNPEREVQVFYVDRDPIKAFEEGVIPRYLDPEGDHRVLPIKAHLNNIKSREAIKQLYERYKDNPRVRFEFIGNYGEKGAYTETSIENIASKVYNIDEIGAILEKGIKEKLNAGILTKEAADAFRGKTSSIHGDMRPSGADSNQEHSLKLRSKPKTPSKFYNQLVDIFGDKEAGNVIDDLISKTPSENVKFLLFSELADVQPIALSEMPETYLRAGNGRIFYMLKTYTIKQIDVFRNEVFLQMKDNPAKALGNLVRLSALLIFANATADVIKDFLLGRPMDSEDEDYWTTKLVDNIIRLFGISKYSLYRFKKDGVSEGISSIVLPPIFNFVARGAKDIDKAMKDDGEFEAHQAEIIQSVPLLGKLYYWWFGGGRKKIEDEA